MLIFHYIIKVHGIHTAIAMLNRKLCMYAFIILKCTQTDNILLLVAYKILINGSMFALMFITRLKCI